MQPAVIIGCPIQLCLCPRKFCSYNIWLSQLINKKCASKLTDRQKQKTDVANQYPVCTITLVSWQNARQLVMPSIWFSIALLSVMPRSSSGNGWALSLLRGKSTASAAGLSLALKHRGNERRTSRAESVRRSVSVFLQISETQEMLLSFYFASTNNYNIL